MGFSWSDIEEGAKDAGDWIGDHAIEVAAVLNPAMLLANLGTVTSGMAAKEGYDAGEDAKDAAVRAAEAERELTDEQTRVMREENKRTEATARARAAASGLSGASSEIYISALEESGRADIDWLQKVGVSNEQSQIDAGTSAFHAARSQMWGNIGGMIPGVGSVVKLFA